MPFPLSTSMAAVAVAALAGDWDAVSLAMPKGLDYSAVIEPKTGYTLLHLACLHNQRAVVQALLRQPQLDVNATDYTGQSALHVACHYELLDIVEDLLAVPSLSIDLQDKDGYTALHVCMYHSQPTCATRLLAAGANPRLRSTDGETPSAIASALGKDGMLVPSVDAP
ncbi:hypothetical protein SPRG_12293 [Saprolegnia parasitica CBS 223.65]|uniref:Uncharacterized protein n=1 Tax=Saprolegnia parasitica (strain CBS 223.65) TaxID=695850 RepID=A0A067BUP9_SAPPC|nr:hypothetical protein SPRG_12293 [Saprolegnia parasitica CBS 223.65]KDO22209.1 hypothetical protein SPRG_12293 [Saprolegnia parasitica CBS 223.65]|eukprot:XP_012207050.1 hypothetical protein SPRG_12293 [Saprolegnia parasitica CBS 223.65]